MLKRRRRPDPEVRRLLWQLGSASSMGESRPVSWVRRDWQLAVKAFGSREPVASAEDQTILHESRADGKIRLRIYRPRHAPKPAPALVWFHGGGFVFGDLYTAGSTCRALANRTGAVVIAVAYRLAPEHGLEAGRADCMAAVRHVVERADDLGIDRARIAVGGDSAGGGIAALIAHRCLLEGMQLAAQVLVYPATDLAGQHASAREAMPGLLTPEAMDWIRARIAEKSDLDDPESSALRIPELRGVAPAIVLTAGFDPLLDEDLAYIERLRRASVRVRHLHYPGQIHGFLSMDRVLSGARHALDLIGVHLGAAFTGQFDPGMDVDLRGPGSDLGLLWVHPRQRWHEIRVAALVAGEGIKRLSGHARATNGLPRAHDERGLIHP